jgi:hypothetical protein
MYTKIKMAPPTVVFYENIITNLAAMYTAEGDEHGRVWLDAASK